MMKKVSIMLIVLLLFSALPIEASTETAKLLSLEGDVQVLRLGGEKPFRAFVDMRLMEGDSIITALDGSARIQISETRTVIVGENTRIYISELQVEDGAQRTTINLESGGIGSRVRDIMTDRSRFEIRTPTAVMGVRGTDFFTSYHNGQIDVRTLEGSVQVTAQIPANSALAVEAADSVSHYVNALEQLRFSESSPSDTPPEPFTLEEMEPALINWVAEIAKETPEMVPEHIRDTIDKELEKSQKRLESMTVKIDAQQGAFEGLRGMLTGLIRSISSRVNTPPGHGGTPPGQENTPPGQGGTPPGQENTPPGQGGTPPGQENTPPGQGSTPPGQEDTPPGQENTPPGQGGTPPGQLITPPGQGGTPPGQGGTPPGQQ